MTEHLLNFILNRKLCQVEKEPRKKRGPENFPVPHLEESSRVQPGQKGLNLFLRNNGEKHIGSLLSACVEGCLAVENRRRAILRVRVDEGAASFHLIDEGLQPSPSSGILVVFPSDGQSNPVPCRHDNTGGPNLDVEFVGLSGGKRFQLIMGVVGSVFGAEFRIEFSVRSPEPSLADREYGDRGPPEKPPLSCRERKREGPGRDPRRPWRMK